MVKIWKGSFVFDTLTKVRYLALLRGVFSAIKRTLQALANEVWTHWLLITLFMAAIPVAIEAASWPPPYPPYGIPTGNEFSQPYAQPPANGMPPAYPQPLGGETPQPYAQPPANGMSPTYPQPFGGEMPQPYAQPPANGMPPTYPQPFSGETPHPYSQPPVNGEYNFRPPAPNNARGMYDDWPGSPTFARPVNPPRYHATPPTPILQVELSKTNPYVQESVVLTLRVFSAGSLATIDPVLPQVQAVAFQPLTDPEAQNLVTAWPYNFVTEMRYVITPLAVGAIDLALKVAVTVPNGDGKSISIAPNENKTLRLEVRPQLAGLVPWLPLEALSISSNLEMLPDVESGKPLALELKLVATGMLGKQLPSLEHQLHAPELQVYRGKTITTGGPAPNKQHVMGMRTEHYTLVPQYSGKLRLPPVQMVWFNVHTGTAERASLVIDATAGINQNSSSQGWFASMSYSVWLALAVPIMLIMLFLGYWLGVRYQGTWVYPPTLLDMLPGLWSSVRGVTLPVQRLFKRYLIVAVNWWRLYWHRVTSRAARYVMSRLPMAVQLWLWVRTANLETTPAAWLKTVQFLSWHVLGGSPHTTSVVTVRRIMQWQPQSRHGDLQRLFGLLDGAIYANQALDFARWKQEFAEHIRPSLGYILWQLLARPEASRQGLPALNPSI